MCAGDMYRTSRSYRKLGVVLEVANALENSTLEGDRLGPTKRYARAEAREQSRAWLVRARVRVR